MTYGHRIVGFEPLGGKRLLLQFKDGTTRSYDFALDANRGGFFGDILLDSFMRDVAVVEHGAGLEWPSGLGYCADYLWQAGELVTKGAEVAVAVQLRCADDVTYRRCRVLTTDPGTGAMRHADAGYEDALQFAREHGVKVSGVLE